MANFVRALATSTTSTKPLIGIATAAGSATSEFALKARMCYIAPVATRCVRRKSRD